MKPKLELIKCLEENSELIDVQYILNKKLEGVKDPLVRNQIILEELIDKLTELRKNITSLLNTIEKK